LNALDGIDLRAEVWHLPRSSGYRRMRGPPAGFERIAQSARGKVLASNEVGAFFLAQNLRR
jgi:hypothetical protein